MFSLHGKATDHALVLIKQTMKCSSQWCCFLKGQPGSNGKTSDAVTLSLPAFLCFSSLQGKSFFFENNATRPPTSFQSLLLPQFILFDASKPLLVKNPADIDSTELLRHLPKISCSKRKIASMTKLLKIKAHMPANRWRADNACSHASIGPLGPANP